MNDHIETRSFIILLTGEFRFHSEFLPGLYELFSSSKNISSSKTRSTNLSAFAVLFWWWPLKWWWPLFLIYIPWFSDILIKAGAADSRLFSNDIFDVTLIEAWVRLCFYLLLLWVTTERKVLRFDDGLTVVFFIIGIPLVIIFVYLLTFILLFLYLILT